MAVSKVIYKGTVLVDLTEDTITPEDLALGVTAHKSNGEQITGAMLNQGGVSGELTSISEPYQVPEGYHDGSGIVTIAATEAAKLIPENIKLGIDVLGVVGTCVTEVTAQSKTVTPSTSSQTIVPDSGYDYLSQVNVGAIPYTELQNSSGGITVKIGVVSS